mgnify:CR=1 FL=1
MVDTADSRSAIIKNYLLIEICKVMAMKKKLIGSLRRVADDLPLNLSEGMILTLIVVVEIVNASEESSVGAHHGILMFGILHAVTALPEILHGLDELIKAQEEL